MLLLPCTFHYPCTVVCAWWQTRKETLYSIFLLHSQWNLLQILRTALKPPAANTHLLKVTSSASNYSLSQLRLLHCSLCFTVPFFFLSYAVPDNLIRPFFQHFSLSVLHLCIAFLSPDTSYVLRIAGEYFVRFFLVWGGFVMLILSYAHVHDLWCIP